MISFTLFYLIFVNLSYALLSSGGGSLRVGEINLKTCGGTKIYASSIRKSPRMWNNSVPFLWSGGDFLQKKYIIMCRKDLVLCGSSITLSSITG